MERLTNRARLLGPAFLLVIFAIGLTGCASKKALPFAYSTPKIARTNAPVLILAHTGDQRSAKGNMDKVLDLPGCFDPVICKELTGSGLFIRVDPKPVATNADYQL